jgi:sodium/hydrogen antiporter
MSQLALFVAVVFFYSLFSERLARTVITAPILFTAAGMATFAFLPPAVERGSLLVPLLIVAELGLVMLLYTDASGTDLGVLKRIKNQPVRLLSTGMLLTIALGALAAKLVFPEFSFWEAGILAAILAPTDASLGQVIVTSRKVPLLVREALNVEAGLNDGLSVPFLLFFLALAEAGALGAKASFATFVAQQLGLGALIGLGIGLVGGFLLMIGAGRGWMSGSFMQVGVISLPLLCALASEASGASMFIAAFVAGLAVQVGFKKAGKHSSDFTDESGQFLMLGVFFAFGMVVVRDWRDITLSHVLYALISLTVVRMLPVAVALIGTRLSKASILFMGWFGPRGLASIVLGLVFLERDAKLPGEHTIQLTVMVTALLSIFLHGLSAQPGISLYAKALSKLAPDSPERQALDG